MVLRSKTRVGVLRGGVSRGHDASVRTGAHVLKNLPEHYAAVDIFVDKSGVWHIQGVAEPVAKILKKVDMVFNATHSDPGEDKLPESFLDAFAVPHTGTGRIASALAKHKAYGKSFLKGLGVKTPHHKILKKNRAGIGNPLEIWKSIPNPSLIRPLGAGISDEARMVNNFSELESALEQIFRRADSALVEESIAGRQAACAVIDSFRGEKIYSLLPIEFAVSAGGGVETFHPGRFSALEKYYMQETAKKVHELFGFRHYSCSNFVVSPNRGVYFLGAESGPYLGADSPYIESFIAVGLTFGGFLDHVIKLVLNNR